MPILDRIGHLVQKHRHKGRSHRHHQENRKPDHQRDKGPAQHVVDPLNLAQKGKRYGIPHHPADTPDQHGGNHRQQPEGQGDPPPQNLAEPRVANLLQGFEETCENHSDTHDVMASTSGRGRSGGWLVSVPIWMNPATRSSLSSPSPVSRNPRSWLGHPLSQLAPQPLAKAALRSAKQTPPTA